MPRRLFPVFVVALLAGAGCSEVVGGDDGSGEGGSGAGGPSAVNAGPTTSTGPGPDCEAPPSPAAFEIGSGERCFARVESGAEVPMIQGPQGGYHMWIALGCADCAAEPHLRWGVDDPATGTTLEGSYPSEAIGKLSAQPWPQAAGIIAPMPGLSWDPEGQPPVPKGTPIRLWIEVLEGGAVVHRAEVDIVVGDTHSWDPCVEDPNHELCGAFG